MSLEHIAVNLALGIVIGEILFLLGTSIDKDRK